MILFRGESLPKYPCISFLIISFTAPRCLHQPVSLISVSLFSVLQFCTFSFPTFNRILPLQFGLLLGLSFCGLHLRYYPFGYSSLHVTKLFGLTYFIIFPLSNNYSTFCFSLIFYINIMCFLRTCKSPYYLSFKPAQFKFIFTNSQSHAFGNSCHYRSSYCPVYPYHCFSTNVFILHVSFTYCYILKLY